MVKDNKISMPSSGGGLIRYFDEYKSKFEIKAVYVVGFIIFIALVFIWLHIINPFGF